MKYDYYPIKSFILIGWWNRVVIQSAVTFYLDFLFLYFRGQLQEKNLTRMKNKILEICKWLSCHIVIDCDVLQYTVKPVLRGHLWDKEKGAL